MFLTLEIIRTTMNNNIIHHCYRVPTLELEEDDKLCLLSCSTIAKNKKTKKDDDEQHDCSSSFFRLEKN
jgi:hypothetical protein